MKLEEITVCGNVSPCAQLACDREIDHEGVHGQWMPEENAASTWITTCARVGCMQLPRPGVDGGYCSHKCQRFDRLVAAAHNANPRERITDSGTAAALTAAARRANPRKVSEVVAELAGLWGLDSDDAAAVICSLADKIRAQRPVSGDADPTPNAGPSSPSKGSGPE